MSSIFDHYKNSSVSKKDVLEGLEGISRNHDNKISSANNRADYAEHRAKNAEERAKNAEERAKNAEHKVTLKEQQNVTSKSDAMLVDIVNGYLCGELESETFIGKTIEVSKRLAVLGGTAAAVLGAGMILDAILNGNPPNE